MSPTHRLPEDAAAEMAYLAELHGQEAAAERRRAETRQALLDGYTATAGAAPKPAASPTLSAGNGSMMEGISPEQLLHLSPEILAGLPPEVQAAVGAVRARKLAATNTPPAVDEPASEPDEAARAEQVLRRVKAELYESESVLVTAPKRGTFVQRVGRLIDGLLGNVSSRDTW